MLACKNKTAKNLERTIKVTTTSRPNTEERNSKANTQKIDESKNWAKNLTKEPSRDLSPKNKDYIRDF